MAQLESACSKTQRRLGKGTLTMQLTHIDAITNGWESLENMAISMRKG